MRLIRLIIVEDEQVICNGLVRHMPWQELGIGEIRTAANAEEALAVCGTFRPDVILSDIRMPGMNGIDLCTKFREKLPDSQIIFISGFSDKEYLMAAIKLEAVSYVEKPISVQELSSAIKKAVASVHRLGYQETNLLHSLLCPDARGDKEALEELLQNGGGKTVKCDTQFWIGILKTRNEVRNVAGFRDACKEMLNSKTKRGHINFAADSAGTSKVVILFSADGGFELDETPQENAVCEGIISAAGPNGDCFLGIGRRVNSLDQLPDSYRTAEEAVKSLSYKGWNRYAFHDEKRSEYQERLSEDELNAFCRRLLDGKIEDTQKFLDGIFRKFIEDHDVLNFYVRNLYYQIDCEIFRAERMTAHREKQRQNLGSPFMEEAQTIREMHDYVSGRVLQCCREGREEQKNNCAIMTVLNYLNEKPGNKNISIRMLADMVYLTPTYLSCVFKKQTGMTIGQYLTKVRIRKAEEYLANPRFKLYQIAAMVGYEDANYFGKIFKKQTGMLPSEYRESKMA